MTASVLASILLLVQVEAALGIHVCPLHAFAAEHGQGHAASGAHGAPASTHHSHRSADPSGSAHTRFVAASDAVSAGSPSSHQHGHASAHAARDARVAPAHCANCAPVADPATGHEGDPCDCVGTCVSGTGLAIAIGTGHVVGVSEPEVEILAYSGDADPVGPRFPPYFIPYSTAPPAHA